MESSTSRFFWWTDVGQLSSQQLGPIAMTIGNFDGVHKGHRSLLQNIVSWAKKEKGSALVLTFNPHPAQILHPEKQHVRLFDYEDQKQQLRLAGIDGVLVQAFSAAFSQQTPEHFFQNFILDKIAPSYIAVGHDFHFGKDKEGGQELLQRLCSARGVEFTTVAAFKENGQVVSTSSVRRALAQGNVLLAARNLGRYYYLKGIVERGDQRGRQMGFPTANIRPFVDFFPRTGVYASWCWACGKKMKAVTNIGYNKTFVEGDHAPIKVETHILDSSFAPQLQAEQSDLYGREIRVELVQFLREERKFSGVEELKKQIQADCQRALEELQ